MNIVFAEPIGLTIDIMRSFENEMQNVGHNVTLYDTLPANQVDLLNRIADADVLVVSNFPVGEEVVSASKNLKYISVAFTGFDHIPLSLCQQKSITISNAAGYSTQAVAELTIGMAINLLRKITPADSVTRSLGGRNGFLGSELRGKTFGIIGAGAIGLRVATLALAFGCRVIAWSRTTKQVDGVEFLNFDQVIKQSDILSVHLPLTEQTQNLIGIMEFEMMKPTSVLINTARGKIINTAALVDALNNQLIAGAAIDVYEYEPPLKENHPLLSTPNTLLLPHLGFATNEAIAIRGEIVLDNIRAWLRGEPKNVVG